MAKLFPRKNFKYFFISFLYCNIWNLGWKKNGKKFGAGNLEVISLADLRNRVQAVATSEKNTFVHMHQAGDVKKHLVDPANQKSLFQVASQVMIQELPIGWPIRW